jgi:hypothetical protein
MPSENSVMAYKGQTKLGRPRRQSDNDVGGTVEHSRGTVDSDGRKRYF